MCSQKSTREGRTLPRDPAMGDEDNPKGARAGQPPSYFVPDPGNAVDDRVRPPARDPMELLALLAFLILVGIPAASFYALYRVRGLTDEVKRLRRDVTSLKRQVDKAGRPPTGEPMRERAEQARRTTEPAPAPDMAAPSPPGRESPVPDMAKPAEPEATKAPDVPKEPEPQRAAFFEADSAIASRMRHRAKSESDGPGVKEPPQAGSEAPSEDRAAAFEEARPGRGSQDGDPSDSAPLDLETLIGSTWLLRVGLGILAIALALFARTVAPQLPNVMKVALAYAGSMAFFGLGKMFEEKLERFARPVMAGGLAFGFFVAFAAHFVPAMQAVSMPVSIVWMVLSMFAVLLAAERWQSEPTAIVAIVLGHVSAQVSAQAGDVYALVMIAFLGLTAILLLLRHQWVSLGLVAVVGSYGAHLLWLVADGQGPALGNGTFLLSLAFLTSYYVIFLLADVLWWRRGAGEDEETDPTAIRNSRALGPTNLVLYVTLTTFVYFAAEASVEWIEWYYLTLGVVQGVLAWLYRDANHEDFVFYPVFGTVLWTIGMFAAFDALVLNLVLASQALILLLAAHRTGMKLFYGLSQAAMAVAFIHYLAYPPPAEITLPLFMGGLGVASVYFAKCALEERWYGSMHLLAPAHAILGGLVVLREAFGFFGTDPGLGFFVFGAQFLILAAAAALSSSALLLGLTTFAFGSPVVVDAVAATTPIAPLTLLVGLLLSAIALIRLISHRFAEEQWPIVFWQTQAITLMAVVGGFVALGGLLEGRTVYLIWMLLPLMLLGTQHLIDLRQAKDAAARPNIPEPAPDPGPANGFEFLEQLYPAASLFTYAATAVFIVTLTGVTIALDLEAPIWIATWSLLILVMAGMKESRGLFASGYTLLFGGYFVFLFSGQYVIGLLAQSGVPHPALASMWAAPYVILVPLLVAVALDRGLGKKGIPGLTELDPNASLLLAAAPYLLGLMLVGLAGQAQLPIGWSLVPPALLTLALVWQAERLDTPTAVVSSALWLGLCHLYFLATINGGLNAVGWIDAALVPLLLFAIATLVSERLIHAWAVEGRDHRLGTAGPIVLIVLATITAMATIDYSIAIGTSWTTAGWSVLGGSMMAAGFALKSSTHRRVALGLLGICIVRVFVVDTVGLSDAARIGAFFVLGVILVGIALLYTRYTEELKSWL